MSFALASSSNKQRHKLQIIAKECSIFDSAIQYEFELFTQMSSH